MFIEILEQFREFFENNQGLVFFRQTVIINCFFSGGFQSSDGIPESVN